MEVSQRNGREECELMQIVEEAMEEVASASKLYRHARRVLAIAALRKAQQDKRNVSSCQPPFSAYFTLFGLALLALSVERSKPSSSHARCGN